MDDTRSNPSGQRQFLGYHTVIARSRQKAHFHRKVPYHETIHLFLSSADRQWQSNLQLLMKQRSDSDDS